MDILQIGESVNSSTIVDNNCCRRLLSKCKRFSYIALDEDVNSPTCCDRVIGAVRRAFFCGVPTAGVSVIGLWIIEGIEASGVPIDWNLVVKVIFPVLGGSYAIGCIWGALRPDQFRPRLLLDNEV